MSVVLFAPLVAIMLAALLVAGRSQIAKGANAQVANGAVLMTIAAVVGLLLQRVLA